MIRLIILVYLFSWNPSSETVKYNQELSHKLNKIRAKGCHCGKATGSLKINNLLVKSASRYAKKIKKDKNFTHIDRSGQSVGDRVDKVGYAWLNVGENLGRGQVNIDQLINDWLDSPSHCKLMMNPVFLEMGLGKYNDVWVLHLGKQ